MSKVHMFKTKGDAEIDGTTTKYTAVQEKDSQSKILIITKPCQKLHGIKQKNYENDADILFMIVHHACCAIEIYVVILKM